MFVGPSLKTIDFDLSADRILFLCFLLCNSLLSEADSDENTLFMYAYISSSSLYTELFNFWFEVLKVHQLCKSSFQEHAWSLKSGISSVAFWVTGSLVGVEPVCAYSVMLGGVYGPFPEILTFPQCTHAHVSTKASSHIWSQWESLLSTWRKLVATVKFAPSVMMG